MYPAELVKPMREDLTSAGFVELINFNEVNSQVPSSETAVLIVNSVCGCAAANARPGVKASLINEKKPAKLFTVFAGVDKEATDAARKLMIPFPPSSPCIAIFKNGELVHMLERHHIEGRSAEIISDNLKQAYDQFC
ncbi:BrxA/BrxB family bacilliredoxin [Flavobacteriaceae bacterium]|jgi:putative YphP/YqiW family bacilliredoxin|nr:BrxA/BrxB family bacilliredoxin [Flavobacteriaceae bacterium]MDA9373403.1 BrxA/BrxB family bacilliredoxin [Flavobacteriaceae bacterium]MDB4005759.1 BrxA/BrxB family bacilliredoxin [Flavobacteriaceae bacterium]